MRGRRGEPSLGGRGAGGPRSRGRGGRRPPTPRLRYVLAQRSGERRRSRPVGGDRPGGGRARADRCRARRAKRPTIRLQPALEQRDGDRHGGRRRRGHGGSAAISLGVGEGPRPAAAVLRVRGGRSSGGDRHRPARAAGHRTRRGGSWGDRDRHPPAASLLRQFPVQHGHRHRRRLAVRVGIASGGAQPVRDGAGRGERQHLRRYLRIGLGGAHRPGRGPRRSAHSGRAGTGRHRRLAWPVHLRRQPRGGHRERDRCRRGRRVGRIPVGEAPAGMSSIHRPAGCSSKTPAAQRCR